MKHWKKILGSAVLSLACAQAWAGPTLSVVPTPATATAGTTFGVDVMVTDIADLYGYQFSLAFDPSVLRVNTLTMGNFLESSGVYTTGDTGTLDTPGTISYVYNMLLGPEPGVNGSGLLLHIDFDALSAGIAGLDFADVMFLDSTGGDIAIDAIAGSVAVEPAPPSSDVPEPASWMLMGLGAAAAGALRRRRSGSPA